MPAKYQSRENAKFMIGAPLIRTAENQDKAGKPAKRYAVIAYLFTGKISYKRFPHCFSAGNLARKSS